VQPRLIPQPRSYRGVTDADPIVSRVSVLRSNEGAQFGMFLQVFADGTVIDGEGVHHLAREAIRPLVESLQAGDLYRVKGHCGGPPTDFVEHVHVVVYERSLGRLRANAFSYSGNPEGCDGSVRRLHTMLDAIQTRLSVPAAPSAAGNADFREAAPVSSIPTIRLNGGEPKQ
jgi:hypothetical protein